MEPVIQMEENVPAAIPPINGSANSLMDETPKIANTKTMIKVVKFVFTLLETVCPTLAFTISFSESFFNLSERFSRIRSKVMMVALME